MRDRELCLPSLCPHNTSGVLWRVNDDPYLSVSAGKVSSGRGFSRIQHIARGPNPWKSFPPFPRYSSFRIEGKKEPWYNRIIVGVRGVYAGVSKRSSRSLWSRKSPFRCPLCHQAIPFEIRRRRELCYLRVWADQRQIPGWDAYVRNWYAWWGFPSRIVNYHNLVAGRGQSLAMPIPYHHASCIRFTRRGGISIRFHEKKQRCSVCVCVSSTRACLVTAVIRSKVWCPLSFPLLDRSFFPFQLAATRYIDVPLIVIARRREEEKVALSLSNEQAWFSALNYRDLLLTEPPFVASRSEADERRARECNGVENSRPLRSLPRPLTSKHGSINDHDRLIHPRVFPLLEDRSSHAHTRIERIFSRIIVVIVGLFGETSPRKLVFDVIVVSRKKFLQMFLFFFSNSRNELTTSIFFSFCFEFRARMINVWDEMILLKMDQLLVQMHINGYSFFAFFSHLCSPISCV